MDWEVIVEGVAEKQRHETEAEANQAAANIRGNDWAKKIEVRGPTAAAPKPDPAPQSVAPPVPVIPQPQPQSKQDKQYR